MTDALKLVLKKSSKLLEIGDKFESYSRILPCRDFAHGRVHNLMMKLRMLFYSLIGVRDRMSLNSSQFEKLASHSVIKQSGLVRANLQLLF